MPSHLLLDAGRGNKNTISTFHEFSISRPPCVNGFFRKGRAYPQATFAASFVGFAAILERFGCQCDLRTETEVIVNGKIVRDTQNLRKLRDLAINPERVMKVNPADPGGAKKLRQRSDFLWDPEVQGRWKFRARAGNLQQTAPVRSQSQKFGTVVQ